MILTVLLWPLWVITWLVLTVIGLCLGRVAWWWWNDRKPKPPRAVAKEHRRGR